MPIPLTLAFRAVVVFLLAGWVFVMYCLARTDGGVFGFTAGRGVLSALFALAMLVPLIWAVTLPELPEIIAREVRARRRWRAHRCTACGYPLSQERDRCAECGIPAVAPEGYRITSRTLVRFVVINLLAWMIGSTSGEAWIQRDERAFLREAEARLAVDPAAGRYCRARQWPNESSLLCYWQDRGVIGPEAWAPVLGNGRGKMKIEDEDRRSKNW